jgi:transcriptional regulator with XRE-family HTH domain
MTLGQKIKAIRLDKKITQSALAKGQITRNMLSAIENDKAQPSLTTLRYIASALRVPLEYLISESDDLSFYLKKEKIESIRFAFKTEKYKYCIKLILEIPQLDDELYYLLALCYAELGISSAKNGSFVSAKKYFEEFFEAAKNTIYNTDVQKCDILPYRAVSENVSTPLLLFDTNEYLNCREGVFDNEFFNYLTMNFSYPYKNRIYRTHLEAKQLIKERKYANAITLLTQLLGNKSDDEYNAYAIFSIYAELDNCYKQMLDFENAYRYAAKRLSMLEAFKT